MSGFATEVVGAEDFPDAAAGRILRSLGGGGAFVVTGGSTARKIYPHLGARDHDWSGVEIAFSDERCVPPDDENSNFGMVKRTFLDAVETGPVHRIKGEIPPSRAAADYEADIREAAARGFDLLLLGLGPDAHIGAVFPHSPALTSNRLAEAVDRPDGMKGVTLTPAAMLAARRILIAVTTEEKAEAVRRAVAGDEEPAACPVRILAGHPDATILMDEAAASLL